MQIGKMGQSGAKINSILAAGFLDTNGVDYATDSSRPQIPVEEVAKRATRFTVLVECLK